MKMTTQWSKHVAV